MSTEIPIPVDPNEPPSSGMEIILHPTLGRDSVQFRQVVRYVESLGQGFSQKDAAKNAGTTVKAMKLQGRAVQRYLAKSRSEYTATAEDLRELTTLQWVERALKAPGDPGYDPRESMAALHEISLIPEVGLKSRPGASSANVPRVLSEETQHILDSLDIEES